MMTQPLDGLPIWLIYPLTLVILLAALAGGFYYARGREAKASARSDRGVGAIAGATLGLLAFLLAFVVGFGVNVWQERRVLVVSEANAISTTYLRAGYLDEPYRTESRELLIEYADQRVAAFDSGKLAAAKARSEEIHGELWVLLEELVMGGSTSATTGQYISSLNETIDIHTERVNVGLYVRVPPLILLVMYVIAVLALFVVGMQVGYTENRSLVAPIVLVVVLAAVLFLIVDLDRSQEGLLRVPRQALIDLQTQLPTLP
jgi:hypothetical protein